MGSWISSEATPPRATTYFLFYDDYRFWWQWDNDWWVYMDEAGPTVVHCRKKIMYPGLRILINNKLNETAPWLD